MPKKKKSIKEDCENNKALLNTPQTNDKEWWKYTGSPSPYFSPNFVVASPSKRKQEAKQSINPFEEISHSSQNSSTVEQSEEDEQVEIYFTALMKSLDVTMKDVERMQLTNEEKWNLIHSYNQIAILEQPSVHVLQGDFISIQEKEQLYSKKNQKIIKLLKNKKKSHKLAPILQQLISTQYIQCLRIILQQQRNPSAIKDSNRKGRSSTIIRKSNQTSQNHQVDSDGLLLLLQGLRVSLSSKPVQWLLEFINNDGMKYLISTLSFVHSSSFSTSSLFPQIQYEALKCLNLCLNHYIGLEKLVEEYTQCLSCIQQIVFGLSASLSSSKAVSAKLLAVFASLDEQRYMVLSALSQSAKLSKEPSQYFRLVLCLNEETSLEVKVNCLVLINTLLYDISIDDKLTIITEFEQLGIESSLTKLEQSYPITDSQKMIQILHTQMDQLRAFLSSFQCDYFPDVTDFCNNDEIITSDPLQLQCRESLSLHSSTNNNDEFIKRSLQMERNKNKELSLQLEELQEAYYSLSHENQQFRFIKEQTSAEVFELKNEISDIHEQMVDILQMLPKILNAREKKQFPKIKSTQQSFTDIFIQFGEQFSESDVRSITNTSEKNAYETLKLKYTELNTVNEFLQNKQTVNEEKIQNLNEEKQKTEEIIIQLNQKNDELNEILTNLRKSHDEQVERNEKLLENLNEEKSKFYQENISLKSKIKSQEEMIISNQLSNSSQMDQIHEQNDQIQQLQRQLNISSQQNDILQKQNHQIQQQNISHLQSISSSNEQLLLLQQTNETNKQTILVQNETIKNIKNDSENQQKYNNSEIERLNNKIQSENEKNKKLQEQNHEKENEIDQLSYKYSKVMNDNNLLNENLLLTYKELELSQNQLERVLKEEKEPLEQEFQQLQNQYQSKITLNEKLTNELKFIEQRLKSIEETHRKVLSEYKLSCSTIEDYLSINNDLQNQIDILQEKLNEKELFCENIKFQLSESNQKFISNENEKNQLKQIQIEFEEKNKSLELQLIDIHNERSLLQEQSLKIQENLDFIQNEMNSISNMKIKFEEDKKNWESKKELFIQTQQNIEEQLELRAVELNSRQETLANQLLNFKNAKNQFNNEISHFLNVKQQQQNRIDEKMKFINDQVKEIEIEINLFTQEKEAFACFQVAEQKKIKELQESNKIYQEQIEELNEKLQQISHENNNKLIKNEEEEKSSTETSKIETLVIAENENTNDNEKEQTKLENENCKEKDISKKISTVSSNENEVLSNVKDEKDSLQNILTPSSIPIPPPPPGLLIGGMNPNFNLPEPESSHLTPNIKLKALNWKKITPNVFSDSLWSNTITPEELELPISQLELLFPSSTNNNNSKKKNQLNNKGHFTILDPRRAQNVAILLSSSKCSSQSICNAIKQMNTSFFSETLLTQLQSNIPTLEEIETIQIQLQENPNANLLLGPAESFFMQISEIANYKERLQLLSLIQFFDPKYQMLNKQIEKLQNTLESIKNANHFQQLLKILLNFGNFINSGSSRGRANGFKLSSLDSLFQMRTISSKPEEKTFLHIFSSFMDENFPHIENEFLRELACVIDISNDSMNDLNNEISQLSNEIQNGLLLLDELMEIYDCPSFNEISSFLTLSDQKISSLKVNSKDSIKNLADLAKFYAFTPQEISSLKFDDFFAYFARFCSSYMNVKKEIVLIKKREEDSLKRELALKERKEKIAKKKLERQQVKQREEKMVDNLFEDLCGGNFKRERRQSTRNARAIPIPSKQATSVQMKEEIMDIWNNCVQKKTTNRRKRTKTPIFRSSRVSVATNS